MKKDIVLAGVGGQGVLSIAAIISVAALENDLFLRQSEVHGMSQRGGAVRSHLRLSDQEIMSDLIPQGEADLILSVEPMESLRYLPYLGKEGWLVTNTKPYENISNYPDFNKVMDEIMTVKNHIAIDADQIARKVAKAKSSNIVMLGAASPFIGISFETLEKAVHDVFKRKGENAVTANLDALKAGREAALAVQL